MKQICDKMWHRPITIVLLISIASISVAEVVSYRRIRSRIQTEKPAEFTEVAEATTSILSSCYADRGNAIGIIGTVPDMFFVRLWSERLIPVVMIDNTRRMVHVEDASVLIRWRLQTFMIVGSTMNEVVNRFEQIERSRFFNHMAFVLIPDWSPLAISNATGIMKELYSLWKNTIYNTKVVWFNSTSRQVEIFGFHPHTNEAAKLGNWEVLTTLAKGWHGVIAVVVRKYRDNGQTCDSFDFDKTMDLGGESINIFDVTDPYVRLLTECSVPMTFYRNGKTFENVFSTFIRHVNATSYSIPFLPCSESKCIFPLAYPAGPILDNYSYTASIYTQRPSILIQSRGYMSQLDKILEVIDDSSRIGVDVVFLITVIFFKFFARQPIGAAILNVFRMISNEGFTNLPQCTPSRIYLSCLLFCVVTMHAIFTGNLASLLTTDIPVRHPKTLEDFVEFGYTIHVHGLFMEYYNDPTLGTRVVEIDDPTQCGKIVLRDPLNACGGFEAYMTDIAIQDNLYTSSDAFSAQPMIGIATEFWPFHEIFNKIIMRMTEADVKVPLDMRVKDERLGYARFEKTNNNDPTVLALENLQFAFVILAIGLSLATLSFIGELAINMKRRENVQPYLSMFQLQKSKLVNPARQARHNRFKNT